MITKISKSVSTKPRKEISKETAETLLGTGLANGLAGSYGINSLRNVAKGLSDMRMLGRSEFKPAAEFAYYAKAFEPSGPAPLSSLSTGKGLLPLVVPVLAGQSAYIRERNRLLGVRKEDDKLYGTLSALYNVLPAAVVAPGMASNAVDFMRGGAPGTRAGAAVSFVNRALIGASPFLVSQAAKNQAEVAYKKLLKKKKIT